MRRWTSLKAIFTSAARFTSSTWYKGNSDDKLVKSLHPRSSGISLNPFCVTLRYNSLSCRNCEISWKVSLSSSFARYRTNLRPTRLIQRSTISVSSAPIVLHSKLLVEFSSRFIIWTEEKRGVGVGITMLCIVPREHEVGSLVSQCWVLFLENMR